MTLRFVAALSSTALTALALCHCSGANPDAPARTTTAPTTSPPTSPPPTSPTTSTAPLTTMEQLAACTVVAANGQLSVSVDATGATIGGPSNFVTTVKSSASSGSNECSGEQGFGRAFLVSWGDDPQNTRADFSDQPMASAGCLDPLRHVYSVPGAYIAEAELFGGTIGGTDQQSVAWTGSTSVQVPGTAPATSTLDVAASAGGSTLYYQGGQNGYSVAWTWSPTKALGIEAALVRDDGTTLVSHVSCPAAYVGKGSLDLSLGGTQFDAELAKGAIHVRPRIRLYDGQMQVVEKLGDAISYTAQLDPTFAPPTVTASGTSHQVTVDYFTSFPTCSSYSVEWGDGTPATVQDVVPPSDGCLLSNGAQTVAISHTYKSSGTYSIQVKTSEIAPNSRIADIVPYYAFTTMVP